MRKIFLLSLMLSGYMIQSKQIVQISVPKCGTHLLMHCLSLLTGITGDDIGPMMNIMQRQAYNSAQIAERLHEQERDRIWWTHMTYDKEKANVLLQSGYPTFFIYRDPRDKIVSYVFYYMKRRGITLDVNTAITEVILYGNLDFKRKTKSIDEHFRRYFPWFDHPGILPIRFEDLVGPMGGGSLETQLALVRAIADHIQVDCSDERIAEVARTMFGANQLSHTFRKGLIGDWKEHFTPEHKELFKQVAGQLLIDLGYEIDLNW